MLRRLETRKQAVRRLWRCGLLLESRFNTEAERDRGTEKRKRNAERQRRRGAEGRQVWV